MLTVEHEDRITRAVFITAIIAGVLGFLLGHSIGQ